MFTEEVPIGDETDSPAMAAVQTWQEWILMRKFDYRAPRFPVDFPVRLTLDGSTQPGRCIEISTEGMKLELKEPLAPDSNGVVRFSFQDVSLELVVRVAHSGVSFDGVKFVYETDEQRDEINRMVARLSAPQHRSRPVLVRQ
jgi:hypothetical protein